MYWLLLGNSECFYMWLRLNQTHTLEYWKKKGFDRVIYTLNSNRVILNNWFSKYKHISHKIHRPNFVLKKYELNLLYEN